MFEVPDAVTNRGEERKNEKNYPEPDHELGIRTEKKMIILNQAVLKK